jgi:hypothetical protein
MKAGAPRSSCRNGDEIRRAASLSMKGTDRILRVPPTDVVSPAGGRRINAAVPIRSNLLRLEHRFQTVVDSDAWRRRDQSLVLAAFGDAVSAAHIAAARAPHVASRLPCSFKGIGGFLFRPYCQRHLAPKGLKAGIETRARLWFHHRFRNHRGGRAGCPDGTNRNIRRQRPLHKAAATELASYLRGLSGASAAGARRIHDPRTAYMGT